MPQFRQRITVTRPGTTAGGGTDPETGEYTPPAPDQATALYDGPGIFLDQGVAIAFQPGTQIPTETADARVYLPKGTIARLGAAGTAIEPGDTVVVEFPEGDPPRDASVIRAVRFIDCLYLRRA